MKKIRQLLVTVLIIGMLFGNCMMVSAQEYFAGVSTSAELQVGNILYPGDVIVAEDSGYITMVINGTTITESYVVSDQLFVDNSWVGWHVNNKCKVTDYRTVNTETGAEGEDPSTGLYITVEYLTSGEQPVDTLMGQPMCEHTYARTTIVPVGFETDEVVGEVCTKCGVVRQGVAQVVLPNSAYKYFLTDMSEQIVDAPENGEVFIETETWISFNSKVMEALAARPDVSLTVEYLYEGKYYTLTIPAGYDVMSLLDENGYAGFRWVDQFVGGHEIEK